MHNIHSHEGYPKFIFKWLHSVVDNYWLKNIENVCAEPMKILGYANYSSETKKAKDILVKTAEEVWPN